VLQNPGSRVLRFRILGLQSFRIQGLGFEGPGSYGCRASELRAWEFRVLGFKVGELQNLGFRVRKFEFFFLIDFIFEAQNHTRT
jgi:hypothetical protein